MPLRIGNSHGHPVSELALAIAGETLPRYLPCFFTFLAGDDSDANSGIFAWRRAFILLARLWILDGNGFEQLRGAAARAGRAGEKNPRSQLSRHRRMKHEVFHLVVSALEGEGRLLAQKHLNDIGIFEQPRVSAVMRRVSAQRG